MSAVIVTLHMKVDPEMRWQILKTIHSITGPTSAQPDCQHCELFGSTMNDDTLLLLEKWKSQEALEQHIQSEDFRKIMSAMDSASEPPEINFYTIASTAGMDQVENILNEKTAS